ncbi:hypothetical protein HMPREF3190_01497 [Umbribacter vaginalis]|nr:hypothetical protein HMPREF3190_01497 [Coriobacteriales bacterium DNF00809]
MLSSCLCSEAFYNGIIVHDACVSAQATILRGFHGTFKKH